MNHQVYDKIFVYYFSGTGNARNTALWIIDEAKMVGMETEIVNIAKIRGQKIPTPPKNSLIGFISPTHGFHFPHIMRKFIRDFPKSKNCYAFIMNTRAGIRIKKQTICGISGVLHYWSSLILKRRGLRIVGLIGVDLPSNWISLHPSIKSNGIEIIYQHVEPKVRKFIQGILTGKRNFRALFDIIQDILVSPISIGYLLLGRFFLAKSFIASADCDQCDICLKACPVQAIKEVDGRKYWTVKCESCMHCMNICPKRSIESAHGFIILICIIASFIFGLILNRIFMLPIFANWQWLHQPLIIFLLESIFLFPILFAGYRVMHWLMRYKIFERIFVLTSLTRFKFWGRYLARRRGKKETPGK